MIEGVLPNTSVKHPTDGKMETIDLVKSAIANEQLLVTTAPIREPSPGLVVLGFAPLQIVRESGDKEALRVLGRIQSGPDPDTSKKYEPWSSCSGVLPCPIEWFQGAKTVANKWKPVSPATEAELRKIAELGYEPVE